MLDTVSTASATNNWNVDALGNWTGTGSQTRTFNAQNQIASISGNTTPTYDNNGNMTKDQAGNTYTYDAWNRMMNVNLGIEKFTYDANNRRPGTTFCATNGVTDTYYSTDWQVLEEDNVAPGGGGGNITTTNTYVWGEGIV